MRFSAIHKLSSYLMVLSAVLALVTSPDISTTTAVLSLVGIGVSWFFDPQRVRLERFRAVWTVATVACFAYLAIAVARGGGVMEASVHFLLFVLINKLFNRHAGKDYQQAYVVSFLMLVAATILNPGLSYGVFFALYILFTTWSLILFHLRREMEESYLLKHADDARSHKVEIERILGSRRVVSGRFLAGTAALSLGILAGAVLIFTFFPRVGFGFFAGQRRPGMTLVGFSEQVKLGHHGTLRDDPRVVMRVVLPRRRAPRHRLLWRGSALDRYQGGEWRYSEPLHGKSTTVLPRDGLYVLNHAPGMRPNSPTAMLRSNLLRQEIYLEPLDSTILFAADRPVAIEVDRSRIGRAARLIPRRGPFAEIRASRPHAAGLHYVAYSAVQQPTPEQLRNAPLLSEPRLSHFLQLPRTLPDRILQLGRKLTAGQPTVYDRVLAVQRHLRDNYRYTLTLSHEQGREPVDEFLFATRAGHCEYFATAMTLLLRAAGIHARHVNGFAGGAWNDYGGYLAVRQADAHAWTEVLFAGIGWVAFDPTPPSGAPQVAAAGGLRRRVAEMIDALRLRWLRYVIEYDLNQQVALLQKIRSVARGNAPSRSWLSLKGRELLLGAGIGLALVLLVWVVRRRRRRAHDVPGRRARRHGHQATALYERVLVLLRHAGRPKPAGCTPGEFASRLAQERLPAAPLVQRLTDAYYRARFAGIAPSSGELEQLRELVEGLRHILRQR